MPFTPYHFVPSVFFGLAFRKYIDVPVFIFANVIVDVEVLLIDKWPIHRYAHTLLLGAVVGAIWGLAAYPLRNLFKKAMLLFRIPYETSFRKMIISGILGVWLHVLVDAVYHWDVSVFWPARIKPLWRLTTDVNLKIICLIFFAAAIIPYIIAFRTFIKSSRKGSK